MFRVRASDNSGYYTVDLNAFGGFGSCECIGFMWAEYKLDKGDRSAEPCSHIRMARRYELDLKLVEYLRKKEQQPKTAEK